MAQENFEREWAEFIAKVKPRRERAVDPFARLKTEYPFKHVRPIGLVVHRAKELPAHYVDMRYAHDKRAHPEKQPYQRMMRRIHRERAVNAGWLDSDPAWNGVE